MAHLLKLRGTISCKSFKKQGEPEYLHSVTKDEEELENFNLGFNNTSDELYDKAVSIVCRKRRHQQVLSRDTCKLVIIVQRE